ncbi:MAG: PPC domain-containing protein, partial [Deltaproteobacteria bacterium]|nr:PPC domain-containing protein [Deltaproteobacteria bacterium]
MRAQAMMMVVVLATCGCTTKFESDADTDAITDATDTVTEDEVEVPEGCGDGTVGVGEECEGDVGESCWTDCGLEGERACNPLTCQWNDCLAPENCRNDCDDDGDDWIDCSDLEDCEDDPGCEGCPDDELEDNDNPDSGSSLESGTSMELYSCPGDEDWFSGVLTLGDRLIVDALFPHSEGNIDMDLIDGSGSPVDFSATITDDETIDFTAGTNGMYHLKVYMADDLGTEVGNAYTFLVDIESSECTDDMFEDNDSLYTERIITRGTHSGLMLCPGDDDYYSATSSGGGTVYTISVEFLHAEG